MQSWGTQSRFSMRETGLEPSKSGVIGLLCAALGKPREESQADAARWPSLESLASLGFAVRVDRPGRVERDYHTAGGSHHKGERYGVIRADGRSSTPVVSNRYYLADASFLAGLDGDLSLLECLAAALKSPVWPIYLGRKSFVPSCPAFLDDGLTERSLAEALTDYPWTARNRGEAIRARRDGLKLTVVADATLFPEAGGGGGDIRHDVPLSFAERRFGTRAVVTRTVDISPERIRGD